MTGKLIAFGDIHFPQHDQEALEVLRKVLKLLKPDLAVCLGDLLDCKAFGTHAPDTEADTPYELEIGLANTFLDDVQKSAKRLVLVEGNHEHRIARYAARERAGKAALALLSPKALLSKGRKNFAYIPYENEHGRYSHYRITPKLAAVHGWSYSQNATRKHLEKSQGLSIIHGHTHRADHQRVQSVWDDEGDVEVVSAGCLCKRVPTYRVGTPSEWTQGFVLGYLGKSSHTLYFVPIRKGCCVLPDGKELRI